MMLRWIVGAFAALQLLDLALTLWLLDHNPHAHEANPLAAAALPHGWPLFLVWKLGTVLAVGGLLLVMQRYGAVRASLATGWIVCLVLAVVVTHNAWYIL